MFYENNTHHTLFIYMWDGEQDLNDKLVTYNMTWPCYVYYLDNNFYRSFECNQAELIAKNPF